MDFILQDGLIIVTRAEENRRGAWMVRLFLDDQETGFWEDASIDDQELRFDTFTDELTANLGYDPTLHDIRWETEAKSLSTTLPTTLSAAKPASFVVRTHNAWVTAMITMQNSHPHVPSENDAPSVCTFMIVHKNQMGN
ncbi:uncharacterized protein PFLUO_LOCUS4900 [Penicillium psychrofluorescens]|uniref:uncharacterized protein n=1 Tax=Penicillium psychrofluorescens TaxID=3158075 RepID=UPI003CCCCD22